MAMNAGMGEETVQIIYPDWLLKIVDWKRTYSSDEEKMRLAIALSRENVIRKSGGPFGAAVFEMDTGRLLSVGTNQVVPQHNSCLHAEILAIMMANAKLKTHTLKIDNGPKHVLATSCEPCAMCFGAILWSGLSHVICAANSRDARDIGFDEGPVSTDSWNYLANLGIGATRELLRDEACEVLRLYKERGGPIYNC